MPIVNKLPEIKTTDPAGLLWGNDILKILLDTYADEINAITVSREPKVPSDNRTEQLKLDGGIYYVGHDGKALGYPENYLGLINVRRDSTLVLQLVYNSIGIWIRTVNNASSSLEWRLVAPAYQEELIPTINGWENYSGAGVGNYKRLSAVQIGGGQVRLQGLVKTGTNSHFATLPVHLRPANRQILTAWNGNHQPVRLNVDPDGRLVFQGTHTPTYMTLDGLIYTLL